MHFMDPQRSNCSCRSSCSSTIFMNSSSVSSVKTVSVLQALNILFSTALNQLYRYTNSTMSLIQSFKYTTLYSSCLFRHSNDHAFFAAGTVFGELILYEEESTDHFHEKTSVSDHHVNLTMIARC